MKVSRGDVVLLDFPFSDASGGKVRPAIVVQSDRHNLRMSSTIVVLVTKTLRRARREPTQFVIQADSASGKAAGLHFDSAVTCTNLYTVHEEFVTVLVAFRSRKHLHSTAALRRPSVLRKYRT